MHLDGHVAHEVHRFFAAQAGVDRKLKFWHCVHKQFPKYNERMHWETKHALEEWRNQHPDNPHLNYPGDAENPTGGADSYFHKDPLTADNMVIPFRIIHTRKINTDMAADAALAFIDQDDYLGELFRWNDEAGTGEYDPGQSWEGHLLGLEGSADDCLDAAKEKWFVPTNDKGEQYNPKHGMITVVSESAVRTINWYLDKIGFKREFKVHRLEDIREQFRGPGWQIKPSLKSYRLEWPTIRNLEEAQAITGNTLTGLLEGLVEKHLGAEVASYLFTQYEEGVAALDPYEDGNDPIDIWEYFEEKWNSYVAAIKPLGNKVPSTIEPTTPKLLMAKTEDRMIKISLMQQEMAKQMAYVSEVKRGNPELFPAGGHMNTQTASGTTIDRISLAPNLESNRLHAIDAALLSPIGTSGANKVIGKKFPKPAIYQHIHGSLGPDGQVVTDDFTVELFVGYEMDADKPPSTWEAIAEYVNKYCAQSPRLADFGHKVTPEMLKIVNRSEKPPPTGKIICPDPRTFEANLHKSLIAK